jgi:hypothetical protein
VYKKLQHQHHVEEEKTEERRLLASFSSTLIVEHFCLVHFLVIITSVQSIFSTIHNVDIDSQPQTIENRIDRNHTNIYKYNNMIYNLMNQLSKPSKVASTLDWKKVNGSTVLSLNIHRDRIGIAVASHPSFGEKCHELDPLRFQNNIGQHMMIDKACSDRLSQVIEDYKVCGIVVSWPLQHNTGRMGAACGRVLYALEELIDKSKEHNSNSNSNNVSLASPSRPLCLWDSEHIIPKQKQDPKLQVDSFGRCASYSKTTEKQEYRASVEQYHEDENTVVVKVWEDFCREHWPELYQSSVSSSSGDEDYDSRNTSPSTTNTTSSAGTGTSSDGTSSRSKNDDRPRTEQTAHRNTAATADLLDLEAPKKRSLVQMAR